MICLGLCHDRGGLGTIQFCLLPSVYRSDEYWLYVVGQERFDFLVNRSPFSKWFHSVEITHTRCAITSNWSPAREPFKDNVVFVGDSVWFAEAENSGALLSGHKAAHAVSTALHTGMVNREGVIDYINWWKHNWADTHDYKEFLCYPVFNRLFSEEEHNYLHSIVTQKLPWTLNPFKLYDRLMQGIKPHMARISEEKPALAQKIAMFSPR